MKKFFHIFLSDIFWWHLIMHSVTDRNSWTIDKKFIRSVKQWKAELFEIHVRFLWANLFRISYFYRVYKISIQEVFFSTKIRSYALMFPNHCFFIRIDFLPQFWKLTTQRQSFIFTRTRDRRLNFLSHELWTWVNGAKARFVVRKFWKCPEIFEMLKRCQKEKNDKKSME